MVPRNRVGDPAPCKKTDKHIFLVGVESNKLSHGGAYRENKKAKKITTARERDSHSIGGALRG